MHYLYGRSLDYPGGYTPPEEPAKVSTLIIDHNSVDDFESLTSAQIADAKTVLMLLCGESHSRAYGYGLDLVAASYPECSVSTNWSGAAETYTDAHLRWNMAYHNGSSWELGLGEGDFYTNETARSATAAGLQYIDANYEGNIIFGFGWCWDMTWHNAVTSAKDPEYGCGWAGASEGGPDGDLPWGIDEPDNAITGNSVNLQTYLDAVDYYNSLGLSNVQTVFTTGPVDGYNDERGYQRYLKHEAIRDYVNANGGILFDYADILCWSDSGSQYTTTWNGTEYQIGHPLLAPGGTGYDGGEGGCHISEAGCLRIGKAMWVLAAQIGQYVAASWESSVSQYGITWTFDTDYLVGQYVTGDYWVLDPGSGVTVVNIDPASTDDGRVRNGSMTNPQPTDPMQQGFDTGARDTAYAEALNVARPGGADLSASNPLVVTGDSTLMSTISHPMVDNRPIITDAAVLTVVHDIPPKNAFRPPWAGTDKTSYHVYGDVDTSLLHALAPVASTPSMASITEEFRRCWPDFVPDWMQRDTQASNNMAVYGRNVSSMVGQGALMLHLDFPLEEKRELLIGFVQKGIDYYGLVLNGGDDNWIPNGGHASGRKWPILFAGLMLGDADMQNIGPGDGTGTAWFGEDAQTWIVTEYDTTRVVTPVDDGGTIQQYTTEMIGMPEWGIRHAMDETRDNAAWDTGYRRCCTAVAWAGECLAAMIMGAQSLWNHDAFFEYVPRYMTVMNGDDDGWPVLNKDTTHSDLRAWSAFEEEMWDTYHALY